MQSKVLKRPLEELESPHDTPNHELIQESTGERPAKRCAPNSNSNGDQNGGVTTKFSVEIVQQLEFSASNGSAQSQQIQTNVTVKTLAGSVKSETGNPNLDSSQPIKEELNSNNCVNNSSNIANCQQGSMVEFKQEPEGDSSEFPDNLSGLIVEDDLINSDTFKDIMSGIDLSADIDFDIESACASDSTFSVKQEDPPVNVYNGVDATSVNNGVTSTVTNTSVGTNVNQQFSCSQSVPTSQTYYSNQGMSQFSNSQNSYSAQNSIVSSQNSPVTSPTGQIPVSNQLPVTRAPQTGQGRGSYVGTNLQTGLDAAQTLKQMAEQHQQQRQLVMMPGPRPQQTSSTSYSDYTYPNQDMMNNTNNYMNKMASPPSNQSSPMYNNYVNNPPQMRPTTPDELRKRTMMTPVTIANQTSGQLPPSMTRPIARTNQMSLNQYNEAQMRSKMSPLTQQRQPQVMTPASMMPQAGHQMQTNKPMNVTPPTRTSGYYNPMQNMAGSPGMQINVSQSQSISLQVNPGGANMPHQHMMHNQPQNNAAMMGYSMAPRPPPPEYKQTHIGLQQDNMMGGTMMNTHQTKGYPRPSMQQSAVPHQMRMSNSNHSQNIPLGNQTHPSMQSRPNYGPSVLPSSRPTGMTPTPQTMNVNQPMNTTQQQANWRQMMMSQQQAQNMRFASTNNGMMNQYQAQTNTQVYSMAGNQQVQMQAMQQQSVAMRMRTNNPSSQSVHPSNNVPPMHSYMGGMVNQNQVVMPMQHPSGPGRGAGVNPSHNQMQVNMQASQSASMSVGAMHQNSYIPQQHPQQQGQASHVNDFNLEFLDQLDGGTPNFTCSDAQDLLNTFDSIVQNNMLDGL